MSAPGWEIIARALEGRSHVSAGGTSPRAAVAMVLRDGTDGVELLLIRRAEHERDPWSGHVGFPGGRAEPADASLEATAVRETMEETGIDLACDAQLLGRLDDLRARARGRPIDLVIAPFVFRLLRPADGAPSHEVVSLHWLPLATLLDPAVRAPLDVQHEGVTVRLPSFRVGGLVIWGLTHMMFSNLAELMEVGATARLVHEPIDIASLSSATPADGAVCLFLGVVRNENAGRPVLRLEYEAYEEMALPLMKEIAAEARRLHPITRIQLVHRLGPLAIGEASVAIAVSSPHRGEAFAACRFAIDALKSRVPIWKKEHYADGSAWLEGPGTTRP